MYFLVCFANFSKVLWAQFSYNFWLNSPICSTFLLSLFPLTLLCTYNTLSVTCFQLLWYCNVTVIKAGLDFSRDIFGCPALSFYHHESPLEEESLTVTMFSASYSWASWSSCKVSWAAVAGTGRCRAAEHLNLIYVWKEGILLKQVLDG